MAFRLGNALSPDLQYYRLSILPSLLDKVHMNSKAGYDEYLLFEIGKAHHKDEFDDEGLPKEFGRVAGVYASKKSLSGAPYYQAKRIVEQLCKDAQLPDLTYKKLSEFTFGEHDAFRQMAAPFDLERASTVWVGDTLAGIVGELARGAKKGFKLPDYTAGFELFTSPFEATVSALPHYRPLSRYPSVAQDISLKVSAGTQYQALLQAVQSALPAAEDMSTTVEPLAIYQSADDAEYKTITFRITLTSDHTTLTDDDAAIVIAAIEAATKRDCNAVKA
jgi:phenylalanyl-tRNA synthetase beta chain